MSLLETLRKVSADGDVDVLREDVRLLAQAIMEADVTELTGVANGERDPERRATRRDGTGIGAGTLEWARSRATCRGCATAATDPPEPDP